MYNRTNGTVDVVQMVHYASLTYGCQTLVQMVPHISTYGTFNESNKSKPVHMVQPLGTYGTLCL